MSRSTRETEQTEAGVNGLGTISLSPSMAAVRQFVLRECERRCSRSVQLTYDEICGGTLMRRENTVRAAVKGLVERRLMRVVPKASSAHGSEGNEYVPLEPLAYGAPGGTESATPGGRKTPPRRGAETDYPDGRKEDPPVCEKRPPDIDDGLMSDGLDRSIVAGDLQRVADEVVATYAAAGVAMPRDGALEVAEWAIEHGACSILGAKAHDCAGRASRGRQRRPDRYLLKTIREAMAEAHGGGPERGGAGPSVDEEDLHSVAPTRDADAGTGARADVGRDALRRHVEKRVG